MKAAATAIGLILVVGGSAGLLNPREWSYPMGSSKYGAGSGTRTLSKESTKYIAAGSVISGVFLLGVITWQTIKRKESK